MNEDLSNNNIIDNNDDNIKAEKPKGRARGAIKGQVSQKTLDALAKGREKLKNRWNETKDRKKEITEKYAIKKANKLIEEKIKIKKELGCEEMDSEEEEPVIVKQPKKPKKKKTIILDPESDSEEEIIIKKNVKQQPNVKPPPVIQTPKIIFF